MTAFYDFFRYIKLYSTDGTTLEATLEGDSVTDSLNISRGNGVAFTGANASTDSFKIDVDYDLTVPVSTTSIRLSDVNSNNKDIALVAGGNMTIVRDSANQLTISALIGGVSKSISAITQANPARVTTTNAHGYTEGTPVTIVDVVGMTNVNGNEYFMNVIDGNNFDLYTDELLSTGLNSTGFPAYVSGGVATADYGGAKQAFKTIRVSGQTDVVADTIADLLTLVGGTGIDITTTAGTDTISYAIDSTVATLAGSQTLTNKTINGPDNTLTNIANSSLSNSSITFARVGGNSTAASLGDTVSFQGTASEVTVGESSGTFTIGLPASVAITTGLTVNSLAVATVTGTETLTNKTLTSPVISTISNTGTITLPTSTDTLVGKATTDTLTNKSISLTTNTVTGTLAEFSTAVSDATLVSIAGTETLTNKTLTNPTINAFTGTGNGSITGDLTVSGAADLGSISTIGDLNLGPYSKISDTWTNNAYGFLVLDQTNAPSQASGPNIVLNSQGSNGGQQHSNGDWLGTVQWHGYSSTGSSRIFAFLRATVENATDGATEGRLNIHLGHNGGSATPYVFTNSGIEMNSGVEYLKFQGATYNATNITTLQVTDPTAARTITLPDATGTVVVSALSPLSLSTAGTISLGTVPISKGGTGATTAADARTALTLNTDQDVQFDSLGVGTAASGTTGEIRATNNITGYYSSDSRLKENIQNIPDALDKIMMLKGVTFDWTDEHIKERGGEDGYFVKKHDTGLIAQDVQQVLPEIVRKKKDGYLGIQYDKTVGLLVEAIKELKAEIEHLKSKG